MTQYEMLLSDHEQEVEVFEVPMINKGLYADRIIWINKDQTTAQKLEVLAEELGHHYTSQGDILDQTASPNKKQERQARAWGYTLLIPLDRLVKKYYESSSFEELAENLDVTPEYLFECLNYYNERYGIYVLLDNYLISFSPFQIKELIQDEKAVFDQTPY